MRLTRLSANVRSFKTITFHPKGLTLIVGDSSQDRKEGSSNGVGKTLALKLIHHCLGAKLDQKLRTSIPDWVFSLEFTVNGQSHVVERSANGKLLALDEREVSNKMLAEWLNLSGVFHIDPDVPGITFRSLIARFGRRDLKDCLDPVVTNRETDFDGLLRSLYLLGVDCQLVVSKKEHKKRIDDLKKNLRNWATDPVLREMFRAGSQPKVRFEWLDKEIPRLQSDLDKFQVVEDYRAIEREADDLTSELRDIERKLAVIKFQVQGINKSLEDQPDITKEELLELYNGLKDVFRPEMLAHFDDVEKFHNSLSINRKARLTADRARLNSQLKELEGLQYKVGKRRDQLLSGLRGKRALDDYTALSNRLMRYEIEREKLKEYIDLASNLQKEVQLIKELMVNEDREAVIYAETEPLLYAEKKFSALAELFYPRTPAGIIFEPNTGENQLRYNLNVEIEGDDSDGINAAKVICFDWLLLLNGANHNCGFLWHDNRLFAHLDPKARARWFSNVLKEAAINNKQYIASLNTENYEAMNDFLTGAEWLDLEETVKIILRGDRPENKLLGIQFGGKGVHGQ